MIYLVVNFMLKIISKPRHTGENPASFHGGRKHSIATPRANSKPDESEATFSVKCKNVISNLESPPTGKRTVGDANPLPDLQGLRTVTRRATSSENRRRTGSVLQELPTPAPVQTTGGEGEGEGGWGCAAVPGPPPRGDERRPEQYLWGR